MNPLIQLKKAAPVFFVALVCFGFLPTMQAVSPTPDGGYPGGNTAEGGSGALFSLTTGTNNTAAGSSALFSLTTGSQNTAVGAQALKNNTASDNTAEGFQALVNNTTGFGNTATGWRALFQNATGFHNTADGFSALLRNTTGNHNTANGDEALGSNTTGNFNTTDGAHSLENSTTGSGNTALGFGAGDNVTTANNVICIGSGVEGANVSNSCYIGSVFGQTSSGGTAVFINSSGKLGTITSSRRFKEEIKPMAQASEALFALKPVIFRYKKEIEPQKIPQFGLVAEDVEAVNPDLVIRDADGKAYTVRYDAVNAMLLNEFLKEHRTVQEQKATIAQLKQNFAEQQRQIETLTAGLQKVSAQLEVSKPAPHMVLSNQ
ncbi:MAG TPA: tail fiber domain-containing protein [Methylomirabilota bacterium]|nr:tail fiber domain-containing protein [Methylomirabilota bacterium]